MPIRTKTMFFLAAFLPLVTLLSACSLGTKTFAIRGEGDTVLNRDINGKSLSVVVSIYQLKDAREFSKLTFETLASGRTESELLGPSLLEKTDAVVVPGGTYSSTEKLLEDTKYVGIIAFFRRPDPYYWRQLVDADTVRSQGLTFRVQDCYVMINGIKPVVLPGQPLKGRPECATANATRPGNRINSPPVTPSSDQTSKRYGTTQSLPEIDLAQPAAPVSNNPRPIRGGAGATGSGQAVPANTSPYYPFSR